MRFLFWLYLENSIKRKERRGAQENNRRKGGNAFSHAYKNKEDTFPTLLRRFSRLGLNGARGPREKR